MIGRLLVRQLDVEPDGHALAFEGALVGRLHDAGAAAGDHGEAGIGEQPRNFFGELIVVRIPRNARAAEDRHRRAHRRQTLCRLDEL
jgi:hypothetical protein